MGTEVKEKKSLVEVKEWSVSGCMRNNDTKSNGAKHTESWIMDALNRVRDGML